MTRQEAGERDEWWSVNTELLAQLVEAVTVLAADRRYEQPRQIPRPSDRRRRRHGPSRQGSNGTSSPAEVMAFFAGKVHG